MLGLPAPIFLSFHQRDHHPCDETSLGCEALVKILGLGGAGQDVGTRLSEWQLLPGDPSEAVPPRACGAGASGHDTSRGFSRSSSCELSSTVPAPCSGLQGPCPRVAARPSAPQLAGICWRLPNEWGVQGRVALQSPGLFRRPRGGTSFHVFVFQEQEEKERTVVSADSLSTVVALALMAGCFSFARIASAIAP